MGQDSKTAGKLKGQITRWVNWITRDLSKPTRRWVREMVYGIQAAEDVKLSNIARSLDDRIGLIEIEHRLSRQTSSRDRSELLNELLSWWGSGGVGEDTVLGLDIGDLQKRYGKKMEYLAEVRDGSTGEIGKGYWMLHVIGAEVEGERVLPLYHTLYSQESEGWESENAEMLRAIRTVGRHVEKRGIWTIDRGGDRPVIYNHLLGDELRFVIRVEGRRHLSRPSGEKVGVKELGRRCRMVERHSVRVEVEGKRVKGSVSLGALRVRLPWRKEWLWLVVVKGALPGQGNDPILLLTNMRVLPKGGNLRRILDIYLTRWKCEESWRFVKQAYGLEDACLPAGRCEFVVTRDFATL